MKFSCAHSSAEARSAVKFTRWGRTQESLELAWMHLSWQVVAIKTSKSSKFECL